MKGKQFYALDFARVVAMLAVVAIHVTSGYVCGESGYTLFGMNLGFLWNQLSRFAVPMFVVISGISLGLSTRNEGVLGFYKKRLRKLGLPYVLWFTIYFLYEQRGALAAFFAGGRESLWAYLRGLLQGQSAPHLYFVVIIFQCYLVYPLLKRCVERAPVASIAVSLAVTYLVEALYFLLNFGVDLIPPVIRPYLWLLLPTWLFYFTAGCLLSRRRVERLAAFAQAHKLPILGGTLVFAGVYVVKSFVMNALDSIKADLNLYTLLMLLSLFALWDWLGKFDKVRGVVGFLAKHSMTVYFCHVLLLCIFQRFPFVAGTRGMILLYCVVLLSAVAVAFLLDSAMAWLGQRLTRRQA